MYRTLYFNYAQHSFVGVVYLPGSYLPGSYLPGSYLPGSSLRATAMYGNPNEFAIVLYNPVHQPANQLASQHANTPANEKTEDPSNRRSNRLSHQYQDVDPIMLLQSAVCEYTWRGQKYRRVFVKQQDEHLCE
jgi:hypothetical protein